MYCINCNQRKICTIFKFKQEHLGDVEINISKCNYYLGITEPIKEDVAVATKQRNAFSFADDFDEEEYKKLITVESVKEDKCLMTCSSCNGTDYAEFIKLCSKCGKETCGNCATSENGLNYCKECWEAI